MTKARWQSGHAAACKAAYSGSIPLLASNPHSLGYGECQWYGVLHYAVEVRCEIERRLHGVSNAAETYALDGQQHVIVAAGDMIYAFYLYK